MTVENIHMWQTSLSTTTEKTVWYNNNNYLTNHDTLAAANVVTSWVYFVQH